MRTFKIEKDWNGLGCDIFQKRKITLEPGVTVLVGCNGIGKTTLIQQLVHQLKDSDTPVLHFDNLKSGGSNGRANAFFRRDYEFAALAMASSEGENIHMNLSQFAKQIGHYHKHEIPADAKEFWLFFDAVDSGFSIDNVIDLKDFFQYIMKQIAEQHPDVKTYIVVSANAYEMVRGEKCFDVLRGAYRQFKTYDAYRKFIIKTREIKNARVYQD